MKSLVVYYTRTGKKEETEKKIADWCASLKQF